jgi:hypothetical protein
MQEALASKNQTEAMLIVGGFELSKWADSYEDFCSDGNNGQRLFSDSRKVDVFGIIWNPERNTFAL